MKPPRADETTTAGNIAWFERAREVFPDAPWDVAIRELVAGMRVAPRAHRSSSVQFGPIGAQELLGAIIRLIVDGGKL